MSPIKDLSGNEEVKTILLIGHPNVGKSVVFNHLTRSYTIVSNYPGTTVEVCKGFVKLKDETFLIMDTPGLYSLKAISGEEKVTCKLLRRSHLTGVIHVVEALRLEKMLLLTLELLETGLPLILLLNMMDEAEGQGITIRRDLLEKELLIPVIEAVSIRGLGIIQLKEAILQL